MTTIRSGPMAIPCAISSKPRGVRGFTLIELMIVVAVLGILASIAYASYQNSVIKSRRAAAAACVLESAQYLERYYTTRLTYVGAAPLPTQSCFTDLATHYTFATDGDPTATGYSVLATPKGQQASRDTKCKILGLDQKGTKTITGTASVSECW